MGGLLSVIMMHLLLLATVCTAATVHTVPRVSASLSSAEFEQYAQLQQPVVIEGGASHWRAMNWTRSTLSQLCTAKFQPKEVRDGSQVWGQLHPQGDRLVSVAEFLAKLSDVECDDAKCKAKPSEPQPYLHDERVCSFCPAVSKDFTILKYWSENWLLDVVRHGAPCGLSEYVEAWPALFIGGVATETRLHQDHLATSFWMAVVKGRKKYALAPSSQAANLHAGRCNGPREGVSVCRNVTANLLEPNYTSHPRINQAEWWETELRPGDVIWCPPGWFHQAANLEQFTVAISANYVDYTNADIVRSQSKLQGHGLVHTMLGKRLQQPARPLEDWREKSLEEYLGVKCPISTRCRDLCGSVARSAVLSSFRAADVNRNVVLESEELRNMLPMGSDIKTVFGQMDEDADGFVTFRELCDWEHRRARR